MVKKTAFIGQGDFLPTDIGDRLKSAIQNEIVLGCQNFIMGPQELFVRVALLACRDLRRTNPAMCIEVMADDGHQMIDDCDTLICYVRPQATTSVARIAMDYAVQQGKKVVNLYDTQDEDLLSTAPSNGSLFMQKVFN